jgi:hypothetical protein
MISAVIIDLVEVVLEVKGQLLRFLHLVNELQVSLLESSLHFNLQLLPLVVQV